MSKQTVTQQTPTTSPLSQGGILQRKCESCGQHTVAGGECEGCRKKELFLQRHLMNRTSPSQQLDSNFQPLQESRFPSSLSGVPIQTKLIIGSPNDKYEQEADRVADRVMRMPEPELQRQVDEEDEKGLLQTEFLIQRQHVAPPSTIVQRQSFVGPSSSDADLAAERAYGIGTPNDKYEQEADRIADQVMRMPEPNMQGQMGVEEEEELLQTKPSIQRHITSEEDGSEVPSIVYEALQSPGQPLDSNTRVFMESRFGQDFSRVRVHTDAKAAASTQSLNALAYTTSNDIVFGASRYTPETVEGKRLLAHELTHVMQQTKDNANNSLLKAIQREESPAAKPNPQSAPTLKNIIPFEQGDRLTLNHLIEENTIRMVKFAAGVIDGLDKKAIDEMTALLPDLVKRTGTLKTITDDRAVLVIDQKTEGNGEARTTEKTQSEGNLDIRDSFTIELKRDPKQQTISIFVYRGQGDAKELLGEKSGIKVSRVDGGVKLSTSVKGTSIGIGVTGDKSRNNLTVALSEPLKVEALSITRLPKAREGSAEEQAAITKAAASASESRAFKRFTIRGEIGAIPPAIPPSVLLGTSFQVNFRPIKSVGLFFQVPLEVQLQYAPPSSVLAAINSGAVLSLEKIVPINIRLITGIGGGRISKERSNLLGPTLGAGVDYVVADSFIVGIRYQHLFNLVGDKAAANIISLGLSGRFGAKKDR